MDSYRTTQEKMDYTNRVLTNLENKLNNYFVQKNDKEQYSHQKSIANKENEFDYINPKISQMEYQQCQMQDTNSNASTGPSFLQQENNRLLQEKIAIQYELSKVIQESQAHKQSFLQDYGEKMHQLKQDHQEEVDKLKNEYMSLKNDFIQKENSYSQQIATLHLEIDKHKTMLDSLKNALPEEIYKKYNLDFILKQSIRQIEQDQYHKIYKDQIEQLKQQFEERKKGLKKSQCPKSGRSIKSNRSKSQKSQKSKRSKKSRSKSVKKIKKQVKACSRINKPPQSDKPNQSQRIKIQPKKKVRIDLENQERPRINSCVGEDSFLQLKPALKNSSVSQRVQRSVSGYSIQRNPYQGTNSQRSKCRY